MSYLRDDYVVNGKEARAYVIVGDRREEAFYAKDLKAEAELEKVEYKVLGNRATQHKPAGWSGTGEMTIYYISNIFRNMILDYIKSGIPTYFEIMTVNDDPASPVGPQVVTIKQVSIDGSVMALLDVEEGVLEEDVSFTFSDIDTPEKFKELR